MLFRSYDVAEMSTSDFIARRSVEGDQCPMVGLPVFPSRMFRHSFITYNTASGIRRPRDLEGRRIGVPRYSMTAAVWMRGLLQHDYGVDVSTIRWVEGAINKPGPHGDPPLLPLLRDIPVEAKIRLLNALSETGLKDINVGSFVSPKYTPQMAKVDELLQGFTPKPGVKYTYTALNDRGHERAKEYMPPLSARVSEAFTRVDMCDVFAQRNTNRTQAQQMATWPKVVENARAKGVKEAGLGISNMWGSNWIGETTLEQQMLMLSKMHNM